MGTVRTLIGYVKGPKGDTGATGATGPQGPAGQDGAPGVNDYATTEAAGLVRVGDDFNINSSNGTLSIKNAFTRASALAKTVSGEAFATSLGKIAKAVDWVVDNAPNFFNKNADIVDGFTSSLTNKALSANAGKTLKTQLDSLNDSLSELSYYGTNDILSYVRAVYTAIPESGSRIVWGGFGKVRYISFQFKPSADINSGSVTLPETFASARSQVNAALSSSSVKGGFIQIGGRTITIRCQADTQNFLCGQLVFFVE